MPKKVSLEDVAKVLRGIEAKLSQISRMQAVIGASAGITLIEKLASTDDRKTIWAYCDGNLTREGITSETGIKLRTVAAFVSICKAYGLIEEEKEKGGHPKRVIDHVPDGWKTAGKKKLGAQPSAQQPSFEGT